ncbi:hypothetical protein [Noviherbaspirillum denitrificans]|uniref:Uncharacterized protein n=1 Tax=Noviherbaspirillum denitrificans TaxID=1968433 RepID=A0A254TJK3_9BURK|nr:hypothetical protein [Noviherbaspirillum denitrificans]OWW22367.1 hypothetical protein AYR66_25600 [Noviherbaspirillum denitrificans]
MPSALPAFILVSSATLGNLAPGEAEQAYWDCEFAATQMQISLDEAALCSEVYEHLKMVRFDGQFARFLAWWQENKQRELSSRAERQSVPD